MGKNDRQLGGSFGHNEEKEKPVKKNQPYEIKIKVFLIIFLSALCRVSQGRPNPPFYSPDGH